MDYSKTTHARDLPYGNDSNKWNESQTAGAISWTWCKFTASSLGRGWSSRISGIDLSRPLSHNSQIEPKYGRYLRYP